MQKHFTLHSELWVSDSKISMLSYEARGVYIEILCKMWLIADGSCSLPDNSTFMCRLLKMNPAKWVKMRKILVGSVLYSENDSLFSEMLLEQHKKSLDKSEKSRKSVTARYNKEHINKNDIEFDVFYSAYPVKKNKATAKKKWGNMDEHKQKKALNGIKDYIKSVPEGINYCHPSTYLNQQRWEDRVDEKSNSKLTSNEKLKEANRLGVEYINELERKSFREIVDTSTKSLPATEFYIENGQF